MNGLRAADERKERVRLRYQLLLHQQVVDNKTGVESRCFSDGERRGAAIRGGCFEGKLDWILVVGRCFSR